MMDSIFSGIMTRGPRLIAAAAATMIVKYAGHIGMTLDPMETTGAILALYALIHRGVSSAVNPGDAAKGRVASAEKQAADLGGTVVVMPDVK
jgi:hypothetical protein